MRSVPFITCKFEPKSSNKFVTTTEKINTYRPKRDVDFLEDPPPNILIRYKYLSLHIYIDRPKKTFSPYGIFLVFSSYTFFLYTIIRVYNVHCKIFLLNQTVDVRNIIVCFRYTHIYIYKYILFSLTNKITKGQQTYRTRFICFMCT